MADNVAATHFMVGIRLRTFGCLGVACDNRSVALE